MINDWFDGRIDRTYPLRCYREAIDNLPEDVDVYSSARDDIRRAMLEAAREKQGGGDPPARDGGNPAGGGTTPTTNGDDAPPPPADDPEPPAGDPDASGAPAADRDDDRGVFGTVLKAIGPNNADSIPLPLLVLAAIALLLLAAAAASYAARRIQARRLPKPGTGGP